MFATLERIDLERALDAVGVVTESATDDVHFARQGVACLARLVPSELTTLSVCDLDSGHRRVVPDLPGAIPQAQAEAFDRHFRDHPLVRAHGRNMAADTRRVSDLVPARDFVSTPLYDEYYRPL